jgi:hypothetical protein
MLLLCCVALSRHWDVAFGVYRVGHLQHHWAVYLLIFPTQLLSKRVVAFCATSQHRSADRREHHCVMKGPAHLIARAGNNQLQMLTSKHFVCVMHNSSIPHSANNVAGSQRRRNTKTKLSGCSKQRVKLSYSLLRNFQSCCRWAAPGARPVTFSWGPAKR